MYFHFHLNDQGFAPLTVFFKRIAIMEMGHIELLAEAYNSATLACSAKADSASKQMFERLVGDEESHFDQFEKQRDNIQRFGPSYLAFAVVRRRC